MLNSATLHGLLRDKRDADSSFLASIQQTQGLSLVQIDELYLSRVPAWKSSKWVPFGGAASKRTAKEGSLKLGNSEKRNENVAARDLSGDDDE